MNLLKKVKRSNHATIYNEILKRKAKRKGQTYKKFFFELLKNARNRKTIAVGCIKKNARSFSLILTCQKYATIKLSRKLFNIFFRKTKKTKLLL